jgi:hypothetical protein
MRPLFVPREQKESRCRAAWVMPDGFASPRHAPVGEGVASAWIGCAVGAERTGQTSPSSSAFHCGRELKAARRWSRPTGSSAPRANRTRRINAWHSTVWQFFAGRSVIGRNGDEASIADHIDQNFQPHGHGTPFPKDEHHKAALVPAQSDGEARALAWLVIAYDRRPYAR